MRKITFISAALLTTVALTSCKNDWICRCTDGTGNVDEYQIGNSRRPEASLSCDFYEEFGEDCSLEKQ